MKNSNNRKRRHHGVVLPEALWTEFEALCERSNLSQTQVASTAIYQLLGRKNSIIEMPKDLIVAFYEDSTGRRKQREVGKKVRKYATRI